MIRVNVFFTNKNPLNRLRLKNLFLSEDKAFIIGKVEDKDNNLNFISTKWKINKETKICTCVLGEKVYDFSLEGTYVEGLYSDEKKPKKNFYTFKRDAFHCKFYKWVYGKEPHKVHPTMCPYFWILLLTAIFTFIVPLVPIIKLFGKAGTSFMESLSTYKSRRRDRRDKIRHEKKLAWIEKIRSTYKDLSIDDIKILLKSKSWDDWSWSLGYVVENNWQSGNLNEHIARIHRNWVNEQTAIRLEKERELEALRKKSRGDVTQLNWSATGSKYREQSKTSKIIGLGIVIISTGFVIYGFSAVVFKAVEMINWVWVWYAFLTIISLIAIAGVCYLSAKYLMKPLYNYILEPTGEFLWKWVLYPLIKYLLLKPLNFLILKPIMWCVRSLEELEVDSKKIDKIGKIISSPFISIGKGFKYAYELFLMGKDLAYSMYKENCPIVTWTVGDISDDEYNTFIEHGSTSYERLTDIAEKVKAQEKLSEREMAIFVSKTSQINNLIS